MRRVERLGQAVGIRYLAAEQSPTAGAAAPAATAIRKQQVGGVRCIEYRLVCRALENLAARLQRNSPDRNWDGQAE